MAHRSKTICVAGSGDEMACGHQAVLFAKVLGREVARAGDVLLVGTERGFPSWAAQGALEEGGTVIGISPAANEDEHEHSYRLPQQWYSTIIYTGFGSGGRDILLVRSADAVVVGCGTVSTLHEFTLAYAQKKPIGVLEGVWEVDDIIHTLAQKQATGEATLIFESDPKQLLSRLYSQMEGE